MYRRGLTRDLLHPVEVGGDAGVDRGQVGGAAHSVADYSHQVQAAGARVLPQHGAARVGLKHRRFYPHFCVTNKCDTLWRFNGLLQRARDFMDVISDGQSNKNFI